MGEVRERRRSRAWSPGWHLRLWIHVRNVATLHRHWPDETGNIDYFIKNIWRCECGMWAAPNRHSRIRLWYHPDPNVVRAPRIRELLGLPVPPPAKPEGGITIDVIHDMRWRQKLKRRWR